MPAVFFATLQLWCLNLLLLLLRLNVPRLLLGQAVAEDGLHKCSQLLEHLLELLVIHSICLGDHNCCGHLQRNCHCKVLPSDTRQAGAGVNTQQGVVCRTQQPAHSAAQHDIS
jgi:hypothetical protein